MKIFLSTALLFSSLFCVAQQRQNTYLLKNGGERVVVKDSADFLRIVREPIKGEVLYDVLEYYMDGKQKLIGKTSTVEPVKLEGSCLTFFKNGQRQSIANYQIGNLVKDYYDYYPNGKVYTYKTYPEVFVYKKYKAIYSIREAYDSLGIATVTHGDGYFKGYNSDFTKILEEGPIKNGRKDGSWKGADEKRNITFQEKYKNDTLVTGSALIDGKTVVYIKGRLIRPEFPKGEDAFGAFMAHTIRYPAEAREKGIQGTVVVKFAVDKDGSIINIKIINQVSPAIDREAVKVLRVSPKWIPGTQYGQPMLMELTVPINFALAEE